MKTRAQTRAMKTYMDIPESVHCEILIQCAKFDNASCFIMLKSLRLTCILYHKLLNSQYVLRQIAAVIIPRFCEDDNYKEEKLTLEKIAFMSYTKEFVRGYVSISISISISISLSLLLFI